MAPSATLLPAQLNFSMPRTDAETAMDCACDQCQGLCRNKPGWFTPQQIEAVARQQNMTVAALFETHLTIDTALVREADRMTAIYVLAPAIRGKRPGAISDPAARGECTWLKDGRCEIHSVKPAECRTTDHTMSPHDSNMLRAAILKQWAPYRKFIQGLYGKKLKPPLAVKEGYRQARRDALKKPDKANRD